MFSSILHIIISITKDASSIQFPGFSSILIPNSVCPFQSTWMDGSIPRSPSATAFRSSFPSYITHSHEKLIRASGNFPLREHHLMSSTSQINSLGFSHCTLHFYQYRRRRPVIGCSRVNEILDAAMLIGSHLKFNKKNRTC